MLGGQADVESPGTNAKGVGPASAAIDDGGPGGIRTYENKSQRRSFGERLGYPTMG